MIDDYINSELQKSKIVVFGKSTCPFSIKAKKLLEELKYDYNGVELDELSDNIGVMLQEKLLTLTGQRTVPNIFINGEHLGGLEDLEKLESHGLLEEIFYGKFSVRAQFDYDVVVIGGGPAGLSFSMSSARKGNKVCLVNYVNPSPHGTTFDIGGTCTNVGCIPKKLLHKAAILGSNLNDASHYGWSIEKDSIEHNWEKLIEAVQQHIASVTWNIRKNLITSGVIFLNAWASFIDNHTIRLKYSDEKEDVITSKIIVLAVGCRPRYLDVLGSKYCITSDDIFSLKVFPGKTVIIGGSYVALEIASFLNSFKADVTVVVRSEILSSVLFDKDLTDCLEKEMTREGVKFIHDCILVGVSQSNENVYQVNFSLGEVTAYTDEFNTVIFAVGRIPSTDKLCLENVGIKLCSNCKIPVNDKEQTLVKNIFAIGDCANGRPELSASAIAAGRLLTKRLQNRGCQCYMDYRCIPTCLFSWPEYACCGLSESAAIQIYGSKPVQVYTSSVTPLEQAITDPAAKCTAKLITVLDVDNVEKLAGFHIVSSTAGEIIQGFALALKMGATKKDLDCFIGIHPTSAEILTNLTPKGEEIATREC